MPSGIPTDPSGLETLEAFSQASAINRWLYEKISRYIQGTVLEIGSGIGNISGYILKDHGSVSLSDLRPEYIPLLKKKFGGDPHLNSILELDLSAEQFDLKYAGLMQQFDSVIALNVIEHIADDAQAIRNALSLLKKNGRLIILVPAGKWLYNQLDQELGHFRRYTRAGLNLLLNSSGLTIADSRFFNAPAIFGWWFSGKILGDKIISSSKLKWYNRLVPVFRKADWFLNPFTGVSVISVGIKN